MKNKKIGVVGHFTGQNSFGITKAYMEFFQNFGEVIVLSPWDKTTRELDLLVLPGGPDVNPFRYLEVEDYLDINVGAPCIIREKFDRELLPQYIAQQTPIFGICRGHQTLAVHFGAKLNQDMYHETNPDHDRRKKVHTIKTTEAINLIPGLEMKDFETNSLHHQTVAFAPANAAVIGYYKPTDHKIKQYDEEIEALTYFPNYPAHTVQWHPEEAYDKLSITCIRHLLSLSDEEI